MTTVLVTRMLAGMALLLGVLGLVVLAAAAFPKGRDRLRREFGSPRMLLGVGWFVALAATAGSLYFSNVAGFVPCVLCWWQRIAMYPLVILLGVATLTGGGRAARYGAPLAVVGLGIALYHIALQHQPALDVGACAADVPCTVRYVSAFGLVTIPGMAAASFVAVLGFVTGAAVAAKGTSREEGVDVPPGSGSDPGSPSS